MTLSFIDPKSVPHSALSWPAAFRLRPMAMPSAPSLALLGEDQQDLKSLIDYSSPITRHDKGASLHSFPHHTLMPAAVRAAFANPSPEWRFGQRELPHMAVAEHMKAAISLANEQYSQFLLDTQQGACKLSFAVERYVLTGVFHDVTDSEVFAACYDPSAVTVAQGLVSSLRDCGSDGLLYADKSGTCAVVLNPACIGAYAKERALALEWDGQEFTRYYDYRDMHWVDLSR